MAKSETDNLKTDLPLPLTAMVEALLFVSSEPVPVLQIAEALDVKIDAVEQALSEIRDGAADVVRGVRLQRKGDKVQLTTPPEVAPWIERFLGLDATSRLSKPALETLSIIAYQQPVTRAQIEQVRGVNCDGVLSTLLNKGLIEEVGRLETAGGPFSMARRLRSYSTSACAAWMTCRSCSPSKRQCWRRWRPSKNRLSWKRRCRSRYPRPRVLRPPARRQRRSWVSSWRWWQPTMRLPLRRRRPVSRWAGQNNRGRKHSRQN